MLKVFNKTALTRRERFLRALIVGVVGASVMGLVLGFLMRTVLLTWMTGFVGVLPYGAIAYALGWLIRTYGRGVQLRFSVLAVVMMLWAYYLSWVVVAGFSFTVATTYLRLLLSDTSALPMLFALGASCYIAFREARVV